MVKEGKLQLDDRGCLIHKQAESMEIYLKPQDPELPMSEYFNDGYYGPSNVRRVQRSSLVF